MFSVDASSGTPLFTDGPFVESKEHLGGFAVVDVADEEAARLDLVRRADLKDGLVAGAELRMTVGSNKKAMDVLTELLDGATR